MNIIDDDRFNTLSINAIYINDLVNALSTVKVYDLQHPIGIRNIHIKLNKESLITNISINITDDTLKKDIYIEANALINNKKIYGYYRSEDLLKWAIKEKIIK